MNQRMPGPMNQRMPGPINQQMPGPMNQQMPGRMNQQMINQQMTGRIPNQQMINQQMTGRIPNPQMMNQRMPNYNQWNGRNPNSYNYTNQSYEDNDHGNGNGIIFNIIIIVGILACLGALGFIGFKIINSSNNNKEEEKPKTEEKVTPPEEKKTMEKLSLNNISFEYNSEEWAPTIIQVENVDVENTLALQNENYYIVFTYEVIPQYLSTETIALAMKETYEKQGATILNNPGTDKITINNLEWYPVKYTLNNRTYYQILFAKDYDTYAISFFTESDSYEEGIKLFDTIIKTIQYTNGTNENDDSIIELIKGEWDWGQSGYFVFTDTEVYLYENSSKNMNNVIIGKYSVTNGVKKDGETKEGITVFTHFEKFTLDGAEQAINYPDREYLFIKNSDGTYTIIDELAANQETGKKVK